MTCSYILVENKYCTEKKWLCVKERQAATSKQQVFMQPEE